MHIFSANSCLMASLLRVARELDSGESCASLVFGGGEILAGRAFGALKCLIQGTRAGGTCGRVE